MAQLDRLLAHVIVPRWQSRLHLEADQKPRWMLKMGKSWTSCPTPCPR